MTRRSYLSIVAMRLIFSVCPTSQAAAAVNVIVHRLPAGGVQPQVAVDSRGVVHLIYLQGDPTRSDIFYVHSDDGGLSWSPPLRVNSQPGSAIAIGTVRGAQIAIGKDDRIHVAWMGSNVAQPLGPGGSSPMLYARLSANAGGFEPQRNVISLHPGLDGGGSIAADRNGNVFVAWHAPNEPGRGEPDRRVWVARSTDDGTHFAAEFPISDPSTGACGCCGMQLSAFDGKVFALYRGASEQIHRGMYLIDAAANLTAPRDRQLAPMNIGICIMSTAAFAPAPPKLLAAWETNGRVFWSPIDPGDLDQTQPHPAGSDAAGQKHPAIAGNTTGQTLVVWAVGTGWNKGGSIAWQTFDANARPIAGGAGRGESLPAWGEPAVFARSDGQFVIVY